MGKTEDLQIHHRTTKDVQSGKKSKISLQSTEHTNFTKLFKIKGHYSDVHGKNFCRCCVFTQAKNTANGLRYIPKKGCTQSTVASRYTWWKFLLWTIKRRKWFVSQAKFWIFRPPKALWSQTRNQRPTSTSLALISGYIWWIMRRQCYRGLEKLPCYQKSEK